MIDPAYDGQLFKVTLAAVLNRKDEPCAPDGLSTVAVKITYMPGEEVLSTTAA